jgi:hypothetical protein
LNINGHHIIDFVKNQWNLPKAIIAQKYLFCSKHSLSRKKPPRIDVQVYYDNLFNICNKNSAAAIAGASEKNVIESLILYLHNHKIEEQTMVLKLYHSKTSYKKLITIVLNEANLNRQKKADVPIVSGAFMNSDVSCNKHSASITCNKEEASATDVFLRNTPQPIRAIVNKMRKR